MTSASVYRTTVRPRHCDVQGVLHASRYYEYFEDAFLDWLDVNVGGYAALREADADLVVVASGCDHRGGARLGEVLTIEVRPVAAGRSSLAMTFTVCGEDDGVLAVAHTTYVAVGSNGAPIDLPPALRAHTRGLPSRRRTT